MSRKKVLVIEDERPIAEPLADALRREGFDVHLAATAAEGLEAFRAQGPDIVLLDVMLPDGDGRDLLRQIRQASRIPVVMGECPRGGDGSRARARAGRRRLRHEAVQRRGARRPHARGTEAQRGGARRHIRRSPRERRRCHEPGHADGHAGAGGVGDDDNDHGEVEDNDDNNCGPSANSGPGSSNDDQDDEDDDNSGHGGGGDDNSGHDSNEGGNSGPGGGDDD